MGACQFSYSLLRSHNDSLKDQRIDVPVPEQVGSLPNAQQKDQCWGIGLLQRKKALLQGGQARRQEAKLRSVSPSAFEWSIYFGSREQEGKRAQKWGMKSKCRFHASFRSSLPSSFSWPLCLFTREPVFLCNTGSACDIQSSLSVILVPQCACGRGCQQVVSKSAVSLVHCRAILVFSVYHFVSILLLPYGPWALR